MLLELFKIYYIGIIEIPTNNWDVKLEQIRRCYLLEEFYLSIKLEKNLNDFEKPSQKNFTRWILPLVMSLLGLGTSRRDFRLTNHLNGEQTLDIKFASVTCKKLGLD